MKRLIASLTAAVMLGSSITAFAATSFSVNSINVTFNKNQSVSEEISVNGTYDKPIVLRVFDKNGAVVYIDTTDSDGGKFAFDLFQLPKPDSGDNEYKFIISDDEKVLNSTSVTATVESNGKSPGNSGPNGPVTTKAPDPSWDNTKPTNTDTPTVTELPANIDPSYNEGKNDAMWNKVNKATNTSEAGQVIDNLTKATSQSALLKETARNNVATAGEVMTANISAKKVKIASGNKLNLTDSVISAADLEKLDTTMAAIETSIKNNKITLNRQMSKELILNVKFSKTQKAKITISKALVEKLNGIEVLSIKDDDFKISYTISELKEMLGEKEQVSFEIDKSGIKGTTTKKLGVSFDTDKTKTMKISFPGITDDTKYMAIVDENGKTVGGRYNPATGSIEAKVSESGVYQLVNNEKNFEDIKNKSQEMQESIKILAAKGVIEGTSEKKFSPDDTITRAEIAALLLRVLSKIDPNADGNFADVKKSDWFYGTAGSAKNYGMIMGFEDNTFRGNSVIEKDQILTISSRVLKREMKYKTPENLNEWLTFKDSSSIADWAREDVALATMANIITKNADNTIKSSEPMTRGDAALIIMRLFYKIW